jgi:phage terminase large subunit
MFIDHQPDDAIIKKVSWRDNPHFPEVLHKEMMNMKAFNYEKYLHIWEGELRTISESQVFNEKFIVKEFDSKEMGIESFFHGMDFGFANDPSAVVRVFIHERSLYIDNEAFGYGIEINELSSLIRKVIASRHYKIKADCARPETISYLKNEGWNIEGADKWSGSVEDGIEFMRGFEKIIIHPRCTNCISEFTKYSFKIDKRTNEILPIVVDEYNHGIDAIRYALVNLIQRRFSIYDEGVMW